MFARTAIIFLLLLAAVQAQTYTLHPPQTTELARVWEGEHSYGIAVENSTLTTTNPVTYVAIDSDGDGIFDRAGTPSGDVIILYPAGIILGFAEETQTVHLSCNYPVHSPITVQGAFNLVLPAGDCLFIRTINGVEKRHVLTIAANDYTEITLRDEERLSPTGIIFLAGIIGLSITWALLRKKKTTSISRDVLRVLKNEERAVIEYLCSRGSQLAGVVRKDLAIPKTTFHRTIVRLREKGLIVEEEYGNTTKLCWNETFHRK